ncbi:MAG: hypothetical protein AAFP76_13300 [Bacteroidota bacterium]
MRTIAILLIALCSVLSFGQTKNEGEVLLDEVQPDDTHCAGETIKVNAKVQGDLIVAGGNLFVNDSILGDLTAAGGELFLNGYIADDARMAVGRVVVDSEIGDDLVIFGGEVILTENAIVQGNLRCFAGNIEMNGKVIGKLDIKGTDILINGTVKETSKIVGEDISIGSNAQFHKDVKYWNSHGEIDFSTTLINSRAQWNEELEADASQLSLISYGTRSLKLWGGYILSAFLAILFLHTLFRNTFTNAAEGLEGNWLKSFGFGLIYLVGIPLAVIMALLVAIGIPLSLFITAIFIFSLLFGHYIASLMMVYYFKHKKEKPWGFWSITLLALVCTVLLRLLTMIPWVGIVLSVIVLTITYGALTLTAFRTKKEQVKS